MFAVYYLDMYLAIDVGGTKTLMAIFSEGGELIKKHKILTDHNYDKFLDNIRQAIEREFKEYEITSCCCAIPGSVNRQKGLGVRFGNLEWQNVPLRSDLGKILNGVPVIIEHDAATGGYFEALALKGQYRRVLYVAPGTGIAVSFILDGRIDADLADNEAGHMVIEESGGQFHTWEDLASGRGLKAAYGKMASEIEDPDVWADFAYKFARGLQPLIATLQPEIIIIGAGVGAQLHKFLDQLNHELKRLENKMAPTPPIVQGKKPEEAVIYGCLELIKQSAGAYQHEQHEERSDSVSGAMTPGDHTKQDLWNTRNPEGAINKAE
jgi:predicted NBD/HSP70 family sugar kinase